MYAAGLIYFCAFMQWAYESSNTMVFAMICLQKDLCTGLKANMAYNM